MPAKRHPGRKPVDLVAALAVPTGRDAIWAAIRRFRGRPWTLKDVMRGPEAKRTVQGYVKALAAAQIVEELAERDERGAKRYRLAKDKGVHAPRLRPDGSEVEQGRGTENMWRSLRVLTEITARGLAIHASTASVLVSEEAAKSYLRYLALAGYVRIVRPGGPGRAAIYRAVRFTGPRPPMVQRVKQVFDPNLGEVVWPKRAGS